MTVTAVPHRSSHRYPNDFAELRCISRFGSENRAAVYRTVTKPHYGGSLRNIWGFPLILRKHFARTLVGDPYPAEFPAKKEVDDEETG
jgi:hypothetical protein